MIIKKIKYDQVTILKKYNGIQQKYQILTIKKNGFMKRLHCIYGQKIPTIENLEEMKIKTKKKYEKFRT